jgi:hypothetical protein
VRAAQNPTYQSLVLGFAALNPTYACGFKISAFIPISVYLRLSAVKKNQ